MTMRENDLKTVSRRDRDSWIQSMDPLLFALGSLGLGLLFLYGALNAAPAIQTRIQEAVSRSLQDRGLSWPSAEAHGQRIVLRGLAPSSASKDAAVQAAEEALGAGGLVSGGVTKVIGSGVDVAEIVSPFSIGAIKENGRLALEGFAPDRSSRDAIEANARSMVGTNNVVSRLSVASGAPEGVNWVQVVGAALSSIGALDRGSFELSDHTLKVSGITSNEENEQLARSYLATASNGIQVSTDIVGPSEWSATLVDQSLVYRGKIATAEAKQDLAARANDFFSASLMDETVLGETGPWLKRMETALPHFARFQTGQMSVSGRSIRIVGSAPGSVLAFLKQDMADIQDGYTVLYDVKEIDPEIAEIGGIDLSTASADQGEACQQAFAQIMENEEILFASGYATISRSSGEVLDKLVSVARSCSAMPVEIQGHTDSMGPAGVNKELSQARAAAVLSYFRQRGVPTDRMRAVGYGETMPIATNSTGRGRAKNRRIEFKITDEESR